MKKVLIWDISFKLANVGGPAGYLYNIHEHLKDHPNPQITFLSDLYPKEDDHGQCSPIKTKSGLKQRLLNNALIREINNINYLINKSYTQNHFVLPAGIDLNQFDYIHFHQANDVTATAELLRDYKGKTILTTHCPCPRTDEILSLNKSWYRVFRSKMLSREIECYQKADYLMFPCEGAREPYEKEPRIREFFKSHEDKFFYCPSSIMDLPVDEAKMQKYSDLGIPEDAFVITYFGRHNEIKGYDILKKVGEVLLDKYPNLYFLCAGLGPIAPLDHPRWIEIGFIHNAHELLWQSDLYILPNRETYFDLVVLEILRSRTPLFLAANGGNMYFKTLPEDEIKGMQFFDVNNINELVELADNVIRLKTEKPPVHASICDSNRALWDKYFRLNSYVSRYVDSIVKLK